MSRLVILLPVVLFLAVSMRSAAAEQSAPEEWVVAQIRRGDIADLAASPACVAGSGSSFDACRLIHGSFLQQLIWSGHPESEFPNGVRVRNAVIIPDIHDAECDPNWVAFAMPNTHVPIAFEVAGSYIFGNICLGGATFDGQLSFAGSRIFGNVVANRIVAKTEVLLNDIHLNGWLDMTEGRFSGSILLSGAEIARDVHMDWSQVGGGLGLDRGRFGQGCPASACSFGMLAMHVGTMIVLDGAVFHIPVVAGGIRVAHDILVRSAPIAPSAATDEPACESESPAAMLRNDPGQAGATIFLSDVDLRNAKVDGQVALAGGDFHGDVDLHGASIGTSLFLHGSCRFRTLFRKRLSLERASIGDSVMMGGGWFRDVDFTSARIGKELWLENEGEPAHWISAENFGTPSNMDLRNASVQVIRDTLCAWPDHLSLDGFAYVRPPYRYYAISRTAPRADDCKWKEDWVPADWPSGDKSAAWYSSQYEGAGLMPDLATLWVPVEAKEPRSREWWSDWLGRDTERTIQPYQQLATALNSIGLRDKADEVRFDGHLYEMANASPLSWAWNFLLRWTVGFGVGTYGFLALIWVVVLSLIGGVWLHASLWRLPEPHLTHSYSRHLVKCVAATFQHMLPIVDFDKNLKNWLEEEEPPKLHGLLRVVFAFLSLFGWILGAVLLSAGAGLIDK